MKILRCYDWPGNIRELENAVVRAAAMCNGTIRPKDLPDRVRDYQSLIDDRATGPAAIEEWTSLAIVEGRYVSRVLAHTRGNKQAAARVLEVDRKTLERMMKRHGILSRREGNGHGHPPLTAR